MSNFLASRSAPPLFDHPAFQSLVLPLLLAWLGIALLRVLPGAAARWAPFGAAAGLLLAWAWWPGFAWPASGAAQKLPWIVLLALLLAAGLQLSGRATSDSPLRSGRWSAWSASGFVGGGAGQAAALAVAALGLAAIAGTGGSLLLAQLALMLASVAGVLGLWVWLRPGAGLVVTPAALLPLALGWLAIAWALPTLTAVGVGPLVVLALAFAAPLLLRWSWLVQRPRRAPLLVALLALLPVLLVVGWQLAAGDAAPAGGAADDPYLEPRWK